ncbi:MAG: hypothetical protein JXA93_07260 [Anaerolineae bacterium]|nr:hypothetical protein [Anaerolineae bacterium]
MDRGRGLWGGGGRARDLALASALGLVVVLAAFLAGWRDAAAFGLAVIVILDLLIVLRGRMGAQSRVATKEEPAMTQEWPDITYEQALAAFEAGEKLYLGGRIFLVRQALREDAQGLVLWVTDERTLGDHGLLLYADGYFKAR